MYSSRKKLSLTASRCISLSPIRTTQLEPRRLSWYSFEASEELEMLLAGHRLPEHVVLRTNTQATLHLGLPWWRLKFTVKVDDPLGISCHLLFAFTNSPRFFPSPPLVDQSQRPSSARCWVELNHTASPAWSSSLRKSISLSERINTVVPKTFLEFFGFSWWNPNQSGHSSNYKQRKGKHRKAFDS